LKEMAAELALRNPASGTQALLFSARELLQPRSVFLIARLNGQPVGCGALRHVDHHCAQIQCLYVSATVRRRGIGRKILAELEQKAADFDYQMVQAEIGLEQVEAAALFESGDFHQGQGSQSALRVKTIFHAELEI